MRRLAVLWFSGMLIAAVASVSAYAQRAIIVVRHAEKVDDSDDSPLTKAGEERAQALARLLKDSGITAVYTTQFQRTINTVAPLAKLLNLKSVAVHQRDLEGLVRRIRSENPNGIVLVAGHRSTVPRILKSFGCTDNIALGSGEFDSLFIMSTPTQGKPVVFHLRY